MHLIQDALANYGYLAAFLLVFAGAAGLPAPTSLVIAGAGALAGRGYLHTEPAFVVVLTANVLGDLAGYWLARSTTTRSRWRRLSEKHVSLARLERWLVAKPLLTVAVSRFVPFANGGVNGLAGMCRLSRMRFAVAAAIGNAVFAACYLWLGLAFGRAWGDVERLSLIGGVIALTAGGLALAGILAIRRDGAPGTV